MRRRTAPKGRGCHSMSFVARARTHQLHGLSDEALLHFIIALELIFGVREAIQRSVSERVALITFPQADRSFEQQRSWINQIYDLRSKYVHEGTKLADDAQLEEMYTLCQRVFRCLLRFAGCASAGFGKGQQPHSLQLSARFLLPPVRFGNQNKRLKLQSRTGYQPLLISNRVSAITTRILKIRDWRPAREINRMRPELQKTARRRRRTFR
jgi:hypothetical protein